VIQTDHVIVVEKGLGVSVSETIPAIVIVVQSFHVIVTEVHTAAATAASAEVLEAIEVTAA
jgi:hypothetical protein